MVSGTDCVVVAGATDVGAAVVSAGAASSPPEHAASIDTATAMHANRFPIAATFPLSGL